MLLFFLHRARLSREAIVAGMRNVRLHAAVLASTFVLFPIVGRMLARVPVLPAPVAAVAEWLGRGTSSGATIPV